MGKKARAQNRSRGRSVVELYNEQRPHGAIGNKVPITLMKSGDVASPSRHSGRGDHYFFSGAFWNTGRLLHVAY